MSLPLNIDFGQILLHMFNVVLLFGGLYLLLYKPVKKFMDERTGKYEELDRAANRKLADAQIAKEQAEEKLAGTDKEIAKMLAKSKADAELQAEDIIKKANDKKKKMLADAEEAALHERERIISDAREEVAVLAVKAAEKVLMEKSAKSGRDDA